METGPVIPETLETLKSSAQIKAEREHQERMNAVESVTSKVHIPKDADLESIPEVQELLKRHKSEWDKALQESKPMLAYGIVDPTKGKNDALIINVFHDHEIQIKPVSQHEHAMLKDKPHECFQGCEDIPKIHDAISRSLEFCLLAGL